MIKFRLKFHLSLFGAKPLSEPKMSLVADKYMRHTASVSQITSYNLIAYVWLNVKFSLPKTVLPGTRSTNDFLLANSNSMETSPCCNSIAGPQIVKHFYPCHGSTVVVPCTRFCSDYFLRIEREREREIPSNLNCNGNPVTETGPRPTSFGLVLVTILACFISIRWTSHMYYTPGCLTTFRSCRHVSGVLNTGCELRCSIIIPAISTKILPDKGVGPNCRDIPSCRYITDSAWNKCMFWTNVSSGIFTVKPIKPTQ